MIRMFSFRSPETGGDDWSTGQNLVATTNTPDVEDTSDELPLQNMDDFYGDSPKPEDEPTDPNAETNNDESAEASATPKFEEIVVKGEDGKKVKLKFDPNDKEAVKQAFVQKYNYEKGMRKLQVERDRLVKELESGKSSNEKAVHFDKLDEAFQRRGAAGVLDLLQGEGALERMIQERVERETLRITKPMEAERLDRMEKEAAERRQKEWEKAQHEKLLKSYDEKLERANQKEAYALLTPSFERYSASGKLGNESAEARINTAIWDQSLAELDKLAESIGEENITQSIVDRTFRTVSASFISAQKELGKKVVKEAVTKQKAAASQQVQAKVSQGMKQASANDSWEKEMWNSKNDSHILARLLGGGKKRN